ncbi:MAG: hypothetical protein EOO38_24100, partial [Cytophagaceae bacterium]
KFYTEHQKDFVEPEQMRVRRILLTVAANAEPSQRRAAEREAKKVHDLARRPKADFLALAREHGRGPEATRDGELSLLVPGRMVEVDKIVAAGLKPGQVSNVVQTEQGYAIFRLEDHHSARQKPIEDVRDGIHTSLTLRERNERRQAVLRRLKSDATVDVHITFDTQPPPPAAVPAAATPTAPAAATVPHGQNAH